MRIDDVDLSMLTIALSDGDSWGNTWLIDPRTGKLDFRGDDTEPDLVSLPKKPKNSVRATRTR